MELISDDSDDEHHDGLHKRASSNYSSGGESDLETRTAATSTSGVELRVPRDKVRPLTRSGNRSGEATPTHVDGTGRRNSFNDSLSLNNSSENEGELEPPATDDATATSAAPAATTPTLTTTASAPTMLSVSVTSIRQTTARPRFQLSPNAFVRFSLLLTIDFAQLSASQTSQRREETFHAIQGDD
jgi:hypothetical protein